MNTPLLPESSYPRPEVTVDVVLLAPNAGHLQVYVLRRQADPFLNAWALPGGYVHAQEDADTEAAARRVLASKVGATVGYLEQLCTFSGPVRDPRGWSVSVAYVALLADPSLLPATEDAGWVDVGQLPRLAFDHDAIVAKAVERIRGKALYSSLPAFLLPEVFTFPELQSMYERVLGERLNPSAFRRKIEALGLIEPTDQTRGSSGAGRPAQLYRLAQRGLLDFGRTLRR